MQGLHLGLHPCSSPGAGRRQPPPSPGAPPLVGVSSTGPSLREEPIRRLLGRAGLLQAPPSQRRVDVRPLPRDGGVAPLSPAPTPRDSIPCGGSRSRPRPRRLFPFAEGAWRRQARPPAGRGYTCLPSLCGRGRIRLRPLVGVVSRDHAQHSPYMGVARRNPSPCGRGGGSPRPRAAVAGLRGAGLGSARRRAG